MMISALLAATVALSSHHPYAHVAGPVIYKHWEPPAVEGSFLTGWVNEPGCWYLGVSSVIPPYDKPTGICVGKNTYDQTAWLGWFDGYGYLRWVRE